MVFRGERNGRTGLWLLNLNSGGMHHLTHLPNPDGYDGNAAWSPDDRAIAFAHAVPPGSTGGQWRTAIMLLDVASGNMRELSIAGISNPVVRDPVWVRGGRWIAFVARDTRSGRSGRIWVVAADGGQASTVMEESVQALVSPPEISTSPALIVSAGRVAGRIAVAGINGSWFPLSRPDILQYSSIAHRNLQTAPAGRPPPG